MSRIDEALKRAAMGGGPARDAVDASILDRYDSEEPQQIREPQRIREPQPSAVVVAPRPGRGNQFRRLERVTDGKLVVSGKMSAMSVEEYGRLAATLHAVQAQRNIKTLMVTSALPRDGKTLTVTNLALTLSEAYGRRVLLIDADLRRPSIHAVLDLPNATGLGDALRADRAPLGFIEVSPTLTVLPAGQSDKSPVAGLTSSRMKTILDEAAERFDWVLVDSPPVAVLSDAKLMAGQVDGVLMVIAAGQTPYPYIQRAIAELGPERIIGVVLNRAANHAISGNGYYQDYYHSTRGGADHG